MNLFAKTRITRAPLLVRQKVVHNEALQLYACIFLGKAIMTRFINIK
jgi:hypothetical protein